MKTKIFLFSVLFCSAAVSVFAQDVENDDMYFNRKDRAKLAAAKAKEEAYIANSDYNASRNRNNYSDASSVPSRSYSGRNLNPEYVSREDSQIASDTVGYYNPNYANNYNNNNSYNNNSGYYNSYNNPYYNNNYNGYYGYNNGYGYSPYGYNSYGYGYSPYSSWGGWGSAFSIGFGYGYPYYGYGSYYGGWGNYGYGYNGWGNYYPSVVVVNNGGYSEGGRHVVYGARPTRNGNTVYNNSYVTNQTRGRSDRSSGSVNTGGRAATASPSQQDYYNRSWRNAQSSSSSNNGRGWSSWNSGNNNGGGNRSFNNSGYTPSHSNGGGFGGGSFGGGGRSSGGGSFGGGGGGGHTGGGGHRGR